MSTGVSVRRGVAIRRIVAAKRGVARLTGTKVHPLGTNLDALFALSSLCMPNGCYRLDMRAGCVSHSCASIRTAPGGRSDVLQTRRVDSNSLDLEMPSRSSSNACFLGYCRSLPNLSRPQNHRVVLLECIDRQLV